MTFAKIHPRNALQWKQRMYSESPAAIVFSHLQSFEHLCIGMTDVGDNLGKPNQELVSRQLVYQLLDNLPQMMAGDKHLAINNREQTGSRPGSNYSIPHQLGKALDLKLAVQVSKSNSKIHHS